jgi:choline dehydrogenase-like flavoprotein
VQQDHVGVPVMYEVPMNDSLHGLQNSAWKAIKELFKYITTGRGLLGFSYTLASIFVSSRLLNNDMEVVDPDPHDLDSRIPEHVPDIEVIPIGNNCSDYEVENKGIFCLLAMLVKPKSRGTVRLISSSPRARPEVNLGFLANPEDYTVLRKSVRLALRLAEQIRSQGYPLKSLLVPTTENDVDIDKFIRANLRTSYHYTSTCRMGPETDAVWPGVVDDELRVHGVQGLRVCDASVFPEIVAAHTMAPVVVVAEKCADMMKAAAR